MAVVTVVRHAQASFGSRDYDALSALGVSQAEATGKHFAERGAGFDRVLVGPRSRHGETARHLAATSTAAQVEVALDECGAGLGIMQRILVSGAGATHRELLERYLDALDRWGRGGHDEPGCETRAEFGRRVGQWFDDACAGIAAGERVLVVTSAGVVALLVSNILRAPPEAWGHTLRTLRNASITEFLVSGERRSLASFNCTAHLAPGSVTGI